MFYVTGLFKNNTGDISDKFYLNITPASWTFSIWGFIFTWQLLWIIYTLSTICRTNTDGVYRQQFSAARTPNPSQSV